MAVPKRKTSHARKNKRRSTVWKLQAPALVKCPNCGEYKTPHRVCGACGCCPFTTFISFWIFVWLFYLLVWKIKINCDKINLLAFFMSFLGW